MKNLNEIKIAYMGKSCTIQDIVSFCKNTNNYSDINKVGTLTYINKVVLEVERHFESLFEDDDDIVDELCFDIILEYLQQNMSHCNFLLFYVIIKKEIDEVPDYILALIESDNEDEKYDLFVKLLQDVNINYHIS